MLQQRGGQRGQRGDRGEIPGRGRVVDAGKQAAALGPEPREGSVVGGSGRSVVMEKTAYRLVPIGLGMC